MGVETRSPPIGVLTHLPKACLPVKAHRDGQLWWDGVQSQEQLTSVQVHSEDPLWDLPGGLVFKNPPANAGDTGPIPGLRRFHMPRGNWAHVPQLLSLHSRACALQQEKPLQWEARTQQIESSLGLPLLEKAGIQQRSPRAVKNSLI